jgi:hypothetical protein
MTEEELRSFFDKIAPPYLYEVDRALRPGIGASRDAPPSPLMTWWLLLYSFSTLARYEPRRWVAMLDLDKSNAAAAGTITLCHGGRLYHIGISRTHALALVQDLHIRIIDAATGEFLRELTLDPQPQLPAHRAATRTPARNTPQTKQPRTLTWVRGHSDVPRDHTWGERWDSNPRHPGPQPGALTN